MTDAELKKQLRAAGLSRDAIEAAWPSWWSESANTSPSARTELRFVLARSLGLSPQSLIGERVEFVYKNKARFKHLDANISDEERSALNSFGIAVGRLLIRATMPGPGLLGLPAHELRSILMSNGGADLIGLLSTCWASGIAVAHPRVSPLHKKAMHAMVIGQSGRHAILFSRQTRYAPVLAFTLAHEIGHIALGHVPDGDMLIEVDEPTASPAGDSEEEEANQYALEVLLGTASPAFKIERKTFNSAELADAVSRTGSEYGIEPGILALAVAKQTNAWPVAMAAIKLLYPAAPQSLDTFVNGIAAKELAFDQIGGDAEEFLRRVLGIADA